MRSPTAVMAVAALLLLLVSLAAAAYPIDMEEEQRVMAEWKAKHGKNYRDRSEEDTRRVFAEWKAKHGKKYSSAREEERRYAFFKQKLRIIDQHRAAFGRNAVFSINGPFSDQTDEEWRARTQGYRAEREPDENPTTPGSCPG